MCGFELGAYTHNFTVLPNLCTSGVTCDGHPRIAAPPCASAVLPIHPQTAALKAEVSQLRASVAQYESLTAEYRSQVGGSQCDNMITFNVYVQYVCVCIHCSYLQMHTYQGHLSAYIGTGQRTSIIGVSVLPVIIRVIHYQCEMPTFCTHCAMSVSHISIKCHSL